jgi:hypothetical protein
MVFLLGDWHYQYLEELEKELNENPKLQDKYEVRNSNRRRPYLPDWKGIKRKEILSNPDMVLVRRKDNFPEYIIELENNVNYKKLVGIALLTDMAVGRMQLKEKPKLILVIRREFSNYKFIEMEINNAIKNIEFSQFLADFFNISKLI